MTNNGLVLIVDDEARNQKTLQALLAPLSCAIAFAANGPSALAQAAALVPDLILLDVMMPAMDGFEVCRRLRADPALAEIPLVMVTALDDREARLTGIAAGADDFISKPFDSAELRLRVQTILRLNRFRRLLDERARFARLVELAPDGILLVDRAGVVQLANPALRRMLPEQPERPLVGSRLDDLLTPGDRAAAAACMQSVLGDSAGVDRLELTLAPAGRAPLPVEASVGHADWHGQPAAVFFVRDITERKRAEAELRLAATVFRSASEGILIADAEQGVAAANAAFARLTGYRPDEVLGQPLPALAVGQVEGSLAAGVWETVHRAGRWEGDVWGQRKGGGLFPARLVLNAVRNAHGQLTHYVALLTDNTARKQAEQHLRVLAYHDALTGLPNRLLFHTLLTQALARARRSQATGAVLFLDLDGFKLVNDTFGHDAGDQLLRDIARRLRDTLRTGDTLARLGGDEFVILLEGIERPEAVRTVAQKLLDQLRAPVALPGGQASLTASLGISLFPRDGDDVATLLKYADTALYYTKEHGRNGYTFYAPEMSTQALRRLALETSLRRALERDEFRVYYQPRVTLATGQVAGLEALLRWQHPELGLLLPSQFVGLAEETGLIMPIGEWAVRTACRQLQAWQTAGMPRVRLSVNLSARQLEQPDLAGMIGQALHDTGLDPDRLELELPESILRQEAPEMLARLEALSALGVHLSIDNFGLSYASLDYLKQLPIERLKIDRSFVHNLAQEPERGAVVRAIVGLAHDLNIAVTAEGVETAEQLGFLQVCRCDEMQGFYWSAALPSSEVPKHL